MLEPKFPIISHSRRGASRPRSVICSNLSSPLFLILVALLLLLLFMGHWLHALKQSACTQAWPSMVYHVQGHIRQVRHAQTHGLLVVKHVQCPWD